jgi:mRNA-degrading endonuclease RelE of RelBE toxin-antitoxin system
MGLSVPRYRLLYHPLVLSRDIPRLDPPTRKRIQTAIEQKLPQKPEASAKPLAYTTRRLWSLRVGNWRVIFALREKEVWILKIGHRRDVYSERSYRKPPDSQSVQEPDHET